MWGLVIGMVSGIILGFLVVAGLDLTLFRGERPEDRCAECGRMRLRHYTQGHDFIL